MSDVELTPDNVLNIFFDKVDEQCAVWDEYYDLGGHKAEIQTPKMIELMATYDAMQDEILILTKYIKANVPPNVIATGINMKRVEIEGKILDD